MISTSLRAAAPSTFAAPETPRLASSPSGADDVWEATASAPLAPDAALSALLPNPVQVRRVLELMHVAAQEAPAEGHLFEGMLSRAVKHRDLQRLALFMRVGLRTPYLFHSAARYLLPACRDLDPAAASALYTELLAGVKDRHQLSTFACYARSLLLNPLDPALGEGLRAQLAARYDELAPEHTKHLPSLLDGGLPLSLMAYEPTLLDTLKGGWSAVRRPLRRLRAAQAIPPLLDACLTEPDGKVREAGYKRVLRKIHVYKLYEQLPALLAALAVEPDAGAVVRLCADIPLAPLNQPDLGVPLAVLGLQRLSEAGRDDATLFLIRLSMRSQELSEDRTDLTQALLQALLAPGDYPDSVLFELLGKSGCFDGYAATLPWPDPFGH